MRGNRMRAPLVDCSSMKGRGNLRGRHQRSDLRSRVTYTVFRIPRFNGGIDSSRRVPSMQATSRRYYAKAKCGPGSMGGHTLIHAANTSATKTGAMERSMSARDAQVRAYINFFPKNRQLIAAGGYLGNHATATHRRWRIHFTPFAARSLSPMRHAISGATRCSG